MWKKYPNIFQGPQLMCYMHALHDCYLWGSTHTRVVASTKMSRNQLKVLRQTLNDVYGHCLIGNLPASFLIQGKHFNLLKIKAWKIYTNKNSSVKCLAQNVHMHAPPRLLLSHLYIHTDAIVLSYYTCNQILRLHFDYFVLLMALIA